MENLFAFSMKCIYILVFYMLTLPAQAGVNVSQYSDIPEHYIINISPVHLSVGHSSLNETSAVYPSDGSKLQPNIYYWPVLPLCPA